MKKMNNYAQPTIETIEIRVEQGFAATNTPLPSYSNINQAYEQEEQSF